MYGNQRDYESANRCSENEILVHIQKRKAIPVTGRVSPQGCETSTIQHFLDSRLTDGGEVVSLARRQRFTPQEDSWYSFLLEAVSNSGP
jgi:hypothetical protein